MAVKTWTKTSGTLWTTSANWSPSVPATNDDVVIAGSTPPTTGPGSSLTLHSFDSSGVTVDFDKTGSENATTNIVIAAGGFVKLGSRANHTKHTGWKGNCYTNSGVTGTFYNTTLLTSNSLDNMALCTLAGDTIITTCTVNNAVFLDFSSASGCTFKGSLVWNANNVGGGFDDTTGAQDFSAVTSFTLLQPLTIDQSNTSTTWGSNTPITDAASTLLVSAAQLATGNQWYVSTTGNDGHAGTSWGTAFLTPAHAASVMSKYDTLNIAAGTYPLGDTGFAPPAQTATIGAGSGLAVFTDTVSPPAITGTCSVLIPTGGILKGFAIDTSTILGLYSKPPIGNNGSDLAYQSAFLQDIKATGSIDGFYSTGIGNVLNSATCENCYFSSTFDSVEGNANLVLINCTLISSGPNNNSPPTGIVRGICATGGSILAIGCKITATNGGGTTAGVLTTGGSVSLVNCTIVATGSAGAVNAFDNSGGGTISTFGCTVTGGTNGSVTAAPSAASLIGTPAPSALTIYNGGTVTGDFTVSATYSAFSDTIVGASAGPSPGTLIVPLANQVTSGITFGPDANGATVGTATAGGPPAGQLPEFVKLSPSGTEVPLSEGYGPTVNAYNAGARS
jgi:hypothetical protein